MKLANNVDANGRAIHDDDRTRRSGDLSFLVFIAVAVVAKLLFEMIVFFSGHAQ